MAIHLGPSGLTLGSTTINDWANVGGPSWSTWTPVFSWTGSGNIAAGSVWWSIGRYFQVSGGATFIHVNAAFFGNAGSGDLKITVPTNVSNVTGSSFPASVSFYSGTPVSVVGANVMERAASNAIYPYRKTIGGYEGRFSYADSENNGSFRIIMSGWYY